MRTLFKGFAACGTACQLKRCSVLVENERIIAVEPEIYGSTAADEVIELSSSAILAPGFIDTHGHSDISALAYPDTFSKRSQGFTTEITGNCGLSPFPLTDLNREHLQQLYSNYAFPLDWDDFSSYMQTVSRRRPNINLVPLCGHNTLRAAVTSYENNPVSQAQVQKMCALLAGLFEQGAAGLSTGLLYVPGCFADENELLELMKVTAKYQKVYTTHLKSEGDRLLESLSETLALAHRAGLKKVVISHFKTAGAGNHHKLSEALELLTFYRSKGLDIRLDRYPYIESQTQLSVTLPPPWGELGDAELTAKLNSSDTECAAALAALRTYRDHAYWQRMRLTGTTHPGFRHLIGKKFYDITADPAALVIELLAFDSSSALLGAAGMSEENMKKIISLPECFCGSDGNALPGGEKNISAHPRSFGSAAKFARLLLDSGCPLEQLCQKLALLPAQFFALAQTGSIVAGNYADLTVFDPENIDSKADFANFNTPAQGIHLTSCRGLICRY